MAKELRIGMLGCGFMGKAHSNAWLQVPHFFDREHKPVLKAVYARPEDKDKLEAFAKRWGYESIETDWRKLIERDDIDLIDVCVPNNMHHDCVIAAAEAGKIVVCEKPLAMNSREAEEMVAAVEKAGVPNMVCFNYRRVPAIALAKQIIDEGRIGRPFHYRATYNQDYTISQKVPQGGLALWRLDARVAGSGVTGDLLAHSIDTAEWLNGPIKKVVAYTETFVKERVHAETGKVEKVEIDDACMFLAIFENGSLGTFESTRYARGRKNYNTFELNGELGSVFFDLEDPHLLQFFRYADPQTGKKIEDHLTGWQKIHVTASEHPYMKHWWVPGCTIGYEHTFINTFADFLASLEGGPKFQPDMRSGLRTQRVCDAILQSAREGRWVEIEG
ncbi:MAG: Gfo/Idh/MocA family oxidoreductase [Thermogutta sp.]|uniref:Gfo/Idh/MocA family protein n=1 Tax=Thermogutta sp. TaxID=1962930 RepID=UPI001982B893|nr:Gfo/Idh/MocA family oxidoreductase [Thermogutta sp.]MBC7350969.1 Gfo/Idh/MocA family oxidoreductase [Thermogutta sp.]